MPGVHGLLADGATVITATHRLARTLRLDWDRRQSASGLTVWPSADILSLDAWIRRSWDAALVLGQPAGARRLISEAESRLLWRRVLARWAERKGRSTADVGVLVPLAGSAWRLCQAWDIDLVALRAAADSEDARAFAVWAGDYQRLLLEGQWLDMAGVMQALSADFAAGLLPAPRQLGWLAFDPWPPSHAALDEALAKAGCTTFMLTPEPAQAEVAIVGCTDESDELAQAAGWARQRLIEAPGASIAVIVPELGQRADAVRRSFLDILAPGWQLHPPPVLPLSLSVGRVLADYPVVQAALRLLQVCVGQPDFALLSPVLRSVYSGGACDEQGGRAGLELQLRTAPAGHISRTWLLAQARRFAPRLAQAFAAAIDLPANSARRQLPSQWSALFARMLEAWGWPGDRPLDSEEFQAATAWQELLQSWAGCDEVAGSTTLHAALAAIEGMARDRPFMPEGNREGLQILSFEEAAGLRFDHLWVCGMTADRWPPAPQPYALVPLSLQRAAAIPTAAPATLQAWAERRFACLLGSAGGLVLSWARQRGDAELLMSPLLVPLTGADPVLHSSAAEPGSALVDRCPDRSAVAASARLEFATPDPPPPWPPGQRVRGGARLLSMQAVCPARAFIEARLGGNELPRPARPLDPATRGKLLHRLLERLYARPEGRAGLAVLSAGQLTGLFAELIDSVLDEALPSADDFLRRLRELERARLWSQLQALVACESGWGSFTVATETTRLLSLGALGLKLRMDRVDSFAGGLQLVIDYKTGSFSAKSWRGERLQDCQLPLYAVTTGCRGVAVLQFTPGAVVVRGVGDPELGIECLDTPQEFFKDPALDWNGAVARWHSQLELLAAEFAAGDFRVDPANMAQAGGQYAVLTGVYAAAEDTE
jgi:probable DNA repair protein